MVCHACVTCRVHLDAPFLLSSALQNAEREYTFRLWPQCCKDVFLSSYGTSEGFPGQLVVLTINSEL